MSGTAGHQQGDDALGGLIRQRRRGGQLLADEVLDAGVFVVALGVVEVALWALSVADGAG
jgi:hypothetical protein